MRNQKARSSAEWVEYFQSNARSLLDLPWDRGAELTDAERDAVAESLQEFQLGESSDGANGRRLARRYAERTGDPAYYDAADLFFHEEHRHGRDLGRFLDLAGVPRLGFTWRDSMFRFMRRAYGLELMLVLLITVELIAKVYYRAILHATQSPLLRRLCAQILRDEKIHVHFHLERFAILRRHRPRWLIAVCYGLQRVLLAGCCVVMWRKHGRAIRAGGYGWRSFWAACWHEFRAALPQMDPNNYDFDSLFPVRVEEAKTG